MHHSQICTIWGYAMIKKRKETINHAGGVHFAIPSSRVSQIEGVHEYLDVTRTLFERYNNLPDWVQQVDFKKCSLSQGFVVTWHPVLSLVHNQRKKIRVNYTDLQIIFFSLHSVLFNSGSEPHRIEILAPIRSLMLNDVEPSQCRDGWPVGNTGCCKLGCAWWV